jgi:hypothetical protein
VQQTAQGWTNTNIWEELNIFNINKNYKIQITVEISRFMNGGQTNSEENFNIQPKKKAKHRAPTVQMKGVTYSSRGRHRQGAP